MILVGYNFSKMAVGVLVVSLAVLVLVIAYRKLLAFMGRGNINMEKYAVLYSLENDPVSGEIEFYFTCEEPKTGTFSILNEDSSLNQTIIAKDFQTGGNIVRFDSTSISNGVYYYQLETENQKTMKKMNVVN
ncbi:MAG: hypothetical protein ACK5B9_13940 [Flavobacteriia bacterium]|jgi:hypothetical protein